MKVSIAVVLALGLSTLANAAIIPTFLSETSLGGGIFAYTYQIDVQAPDQEITPSATGPGGPYNNHFTFIDFLGLTGTPTETGLLATSFSAPSITATGPSAFSQSVPDSASVSNVTWTYTGTATIAPGTTLGTVTLDSTNGTAGQLAQYVVGQATKATGNTAGSVLGNTALTVGPSSTVPEPATLFLMGGALVGLGLIGKKRAA